MIDYQVFGTARNGNTCCFAYGVNTEERAQEILKEINLDDMAEFGFSDFHIVPTEVDDHAYDSLNSLFVKLAKGRE